jgi:outer membrane protein OmpU
MKKVLFATTALVLTAGIAAADVTISGYGRTGILYQEDGVRGIADGLDGIIDGTEANDVIVQSRLRMNIDASTSTDQGIEFGGRVRLQWDQGDDSTTLSPGYIYMMAEGLRVEFGNSNTAFDTVALMYNSELGVFDRSFGNPRGLFYAFNTDSYPGREISAEGRERLGTNDYMGVFASYTLGDLTMRGSVINPNQVYPSNVLDKEIGISVDYIWNGFELAAAAVQDGHGIEGNDQYFAGVRYGFNDAGHVGLNYNDNGGFDVNVDVDGDGDDENFAADFGTSWTLYGDYTFGLTNIEGYIAHNDADELNETSTAFGIGANYDLGGARLSGSVQRGFNELVTADMGVRFDF